MHGAMNKSEILEHINRLPAVEQVELAEMVLHGLGDRLRENQARNEPSNRERLRRELAEAAAEAEAYYRSDPDVALWSSLEGEPVHEWTASTITRGRASANSRAGGSYGPEPQSPTGLSKRHGRSKGQETS